MTGIMHDNDASTYLTSPRMIVAKLLLMALMNLRVKPPRIPLGMLPLGIVHVSEIITVNGYSSTLSKFLFSEAAYHRPPRIQ